MLADPAQREIADPVLARDEQLTRAEATQLRRELARTAEPRRDVARHRAVDDRAQIRGRIRCALVGVGARSSASVISSALSCVRSQYGGSPTTRL